MNSWQQSIGLLYYIPPDLARDERSFLIREEFKITSDKTDELLRQMQAQFNRKNKR